MPFSVDGIKAGNQTHGHRFMAPNAISVRRFDDYAPALAKAKVVLDPARRRDIILHDARDLALAQGLELVEDEALLDEVAGLVEWPVVLIGEFDAAFLDIPPEVIRATIRANQKCFVLNDAATGRLANKFALVANIEASDGGVAIAAGNARVVRARLSDAKFFWETDRKVRLRGPAWKARVRWSSTKSSGRSARGSKGSLRSHRKSLRRSAPTGTCGPRGAARQGGPFLRNGRRVS